MMQTIGDLVIDLDKVSLIHFGRSEDGQIDSAKILLAPGQEEYVVEKTARQLAARFEVPQTAITAATSE